MNFIRNLIGKVSSKVASSSSTAAPATSGSALLAKQRLAAVILDQRATRIAEQGGIQQKPQPSWANLQYPSGYQGHNAQGFATPTQTPAAAQDTTRAANFANLQNGNASSSKPATQPPPAVSNAAPSAPVQPVQGATQPSVSTTTTAASAKPAQASTVASGSAFDPMAIDTLYGVGPKIRQKLTASDINTVQSLAALTDVQCESLKKDQQISTIYLLRARAKDRIDELRRSQ